MFKIFSSGQPRDERVRIEPGAIEKGKLNLVVSGCGTGKTFFFANHLADISPFQACEILFVTSRAIAAEQQALQYDSLIRLYPEDTVIDFWRGAADITRVENPDCTRIITYDKLEGIMFGNDNKSLDSQSLTNVKCVVFDEIHSVFTDTFISFMQVVQLWLSQEVPKGDKLVFGLTATPEILYNCAGGCGVELNLICPPVHRYKVKNLFCVDVDEMIRMVNETHDGKTIIMCRYARTCYWLQKRIPGSAVLSSKNGDDYVACNMSDIRSSIVHSFKLPDDVRVLIATETIREGFTFGDGSGIVNVVSFFPDEMNIHQFVGRCRYDVENLIVVAVKNKSSRAGYIGAQSGLFEDFCRNPAENHEWLDSIADIYDGLPESVTVSVAKFQSGYYKTKKPQEETPSITKYKRKGSPEQLIKYLKKNWISKDESEPVLIYGDDTKAKIINDITEMQIFTPESEVDSWRKLEGVITDLGFDVVNIRKRIDGKIVRCKAISKREERE